MTQAIRRTYENYLAKERKYERKNKADAKSMSAAKGLLAPRTMRQSQTPKKQTADQFQSVYDAIQMIRNRGS